jgi:hypothetical protein
MADQIIPGLGSLKPTRSLAGESYVAGIAKAGKNLMTLGQNYANVQMEIGRREAEARSQVKMPDPDGDLGPTSGYGQLAEELKAKIGGDGEEAYDFSKTEDILRFKNDVAQLNQDIIAGEDAYGKIVEDQKTLEDNRNTFVNSGKNLRKITSSEVNGQQLYDAHLLDDQYQGVMNQMDSLRTAKLTKESISTDQLLSSDMNSNFMYEGSNKPGRKFVARDSSGRIVGVFDDMPDYLSALNKTVSPDLTPIPPVTGQEFVREEDWGNLYDTEANAEGAALAYVINYPEEAKAAYLASRGLPEGKQFRDSPSEESRDVIKRHAEEGDIKDAIGNGMESLTASQYEYMNQMVEEWVRERKRKTIVNKDGTKSKAGTADDLLTTTVTRRSNATFSEFDLTGSGAGGVNPAGTTADMTQIVLDKPLDARIEYVDSGSTQAQHTVEVSSIGYDGDNFFGVGSFTDPDTNEEHSVKVPLPTVPGDSAPGDLIGVLMQQFDMSEEDYKELTRKLHNAF